MYCVNFHFLVVEHVNGLEMRSTIKKINITAKYKNVSIRLEPLVWLKVPGMHRGFCLVIPFGVFQISVNVAI